MNTTQFIAMLPLFGIAGTSIVLMAVVAIRRNERLTQIITVAGLAGSFGLLFRAQPATPAQIGPLLRVDGFALFFFGLIILTAVAVALLADGYFRRRGCRAEEFSLLLLFATLGSCVLAAATHFASLFLGLEVLSVSLYAMVGYLRDDHDSLEAAIKYLILAAVSSAFMLFGIALIFGDTGSLDFGAVAAGATLMTTAGVALLLVGVGFKLALVPFHMWTADVYEGAPAPVTAFIASASKAAMAAVLVRLFAAAGPPAPQLVWIMALLAAASILAGNLLALQQENVKRLLAYSSIAHLGYLMIAVIAGGALGDEAVAFYLAAYLPTTLAAFGVITVLSPAERDLDRVRDLRGLGRRRPALAGLLTVALLSLAGIPLTAGFIGKFLVLRAGIAAEWWSLALILVLGSVISVYYYLRVIVAMYMRPADPDGVDTSAARIPLAAAATLVGLLAVILWLGIWPTTMLGLLQ